MRTLSIRLEIMLFVQDVTSFSTRSSSATDDTFFLDLQHLLGYLSMPVKSSINGLFQAFDTVESVI
jgi:hypothetical protein